MIKTFYYLNGRPAQNDALAVDWEDGTCVGNVRVGHLGCYFSRGLKYFCVPFAGADRACGRVANAHVLLSPCCTRGADFHKC